MPEAVSTIECVHHWVIETPNGPTSRGVCKKCGTQRDFQNFTDDQARQIMVAGDQLEMGDEKTIKLFAVTSLVQMIPLFKGALVEHEGEAIGRLSKTGKLLAEFFLDLHERGLSQDEIDEDLRELSPFVIAALLTVHRGPSTES